MPWKETCAMEEREAFVAAWRSGEFAMTSVCERFGVSRPTGYKSIRRAEAEGRAGLHDRERAPHTQPFARIGAANDVWSADFKGQFRLGDARLCYPLTLTDNHSRFLLCCQGLYHPRGDLTRRHFERTFREYGLPNALRTDNGAPFASIAVGGLSALSIRLIKLGVKPERIAPGRPQQNSRHERMH